MEPRRYVVLISGTMNPPHIGHVRIGLHAARSLRGLGHQVDAVCFVPVHDNYLCNKVTVTAQQRPAEASSVSADTLCFTMVERCAMLQTLVNKAVSAEDPPCHVLDYEHQHAELLCTSPGYWAPKLPQGYLRTVPTVGLIKHFARNSPLVAEGARVAAAFGIDNLAGMVFWNEPGELLERADLVLVSRAMPCVKLGGDPSALLARIRHLQLHAPVPVLHGDSTLFGQAPGSFVNSAAQGEAALVMLPPLEGADEGLSSTRMRAAVAECLRTMGEHGHDSAVVEQAIRQAAGGAAALQAVHEAASARGELEVPTTGK